MPEANALDSSRLDEFAPKKGPLCSVALLLLKVSPEEAEAVRRALASDYGSATISRWLADAGHPLKPHVIANHRRGDCSCEPA